MKNCPFCGHIAKVDWFGFGEICQVICTNSECGAEGPCKETENEATAAWNMRVDDSAQAP